MQGDIETFQGFGVWVVFRGFEEPDALDIILSASSSDCCRASLSDVRMANPVPQPTSAMRRFSRPSRETEGWTTHGKDFFQMKWQRFRRTESITPRARG